MKQTFNTSEGDPVGEYEMRKQYPNVWCGHAYYEYDEARLKEMTHDQASYSRTVRHDFYHKEEFHAGTRYEYCHHTNKVKVTEYERFKD